MTIVRVGWSVLSRCVRRLWRLPIRRWLKRLAVVAASVVFLGAGTVLVLWHRFPFRIEKLDEAPASTVVTDRHGAWLRVYRSSTDEIRVPVSLDEVSPWLAAATIAVEDRGFRDHCGVDLSAVARATWQNVLRWRVHSGASTLTMQVVRMLEPRPRTLWSKAVEAFHALQIDAWSTKERILEHYLNLAPYGGDLRGVEAASRRYLGKRARDLDLGEAALIAGLPQSPSRLRPDRHYERALGRRRVVLDSMLRQGAIDEEQRREAIESRPVVRRHPWPFRAPHFAAIARARAAATPASGGVIVRSTLDAGAQSCVEAHVGRALEELVTRPDGVSAAVVVVDVESGAVRALLGSPGYFDACRPGKVNGALARRSPGSALKPFLYALAFDRGVASPTTRLADVPTSFVGYVPRNYDDVYHGPVAASRALARSYNVPAVRLERRVGTRAFIDVLRRLGMTTIDRGPRHYGLTLCLGGGEVRLLDLTNAYAALVRGGRHRAPGFLETERVRRLTPVFTRSTSRRVLMALSTPEHLRAAIGRRGPLERPTLGYKTGTSFGLRDAWAVAFSPSVVVGVWMGAPRGPGRADLVGVERAAPLALSIARELSRSERGDWPFADTLVEMEVCAVSGFPPGRHCPTRDRSLQGFAASRLPTCRVHREVLVDVDTGVEVCARCSGGRSTRSEVVEVWSPEVERWFRTAGRLDPRRPHDESCVRPADRRDGPRILSPPDGARYRLLGAAPFEQEIPLVAAASAGATDLFWFVDGELHATVDGPENVVWKLSAGRHEVRCVDSRGQGAVARIVVRR